MVAVVLLGTKFYVSNFVVAGLFAGYYMKIELIRGVAFALLLLLAGATTPPPT